MPFSIVADGVLVEGAIDLVYERAHGSIGVVDYKTDRIGAEQLASRTADYALQVGAYPIAVEATIAVSPPRSNWLSRPILMP